MSSSQEIRQEILALGKWIDPIRLPNITETEARKYDKIIGVDLFSRYFRARKEEKQKRAKQKMYFMKRDLS